MIIPFSEPEKIFNTTLNAFADGNYTWMISPTAFQKNGLDWVRQNPVGTGPFKFVSFERDSYFKTVKNPDYWQKGKPYLDKVEIFYVVDPMTRLALMQSGGGDIVFVNPGKSSADYAAIGLAIKPLMTTNNCAFILLMEFSFASQKVKLGGICHVVSYSQGLGYGYWLLSMPGRDDGLTHFSLTEI
jgi:ABC-type transport system substrate-binding protein